MNKYKYDRLCDFVIVLGRNRVIRSQTTASMSQSPPPISHIAQSLSASHNRPDPIPHNPQEPSPRTSKCPLKSRLSHPPTSPRQSTQSNLPLSTIPSISSSTTRNPCP